MEFPHLGQNCSYAICRQLDFLPVKCDACNQVFCRVHMKYSSHNCPSAYMKNVQVPVCPLCNKPVPTAKGVAPDVSVGAHIDADCSSDSAKSRRKVFANKCSLKKCGVKEMIRIVCDNCKQNFCLKHRHPVDHQCNKTKSIGNVGVSYNRSSVSQNSTNSLQNQTSGKKNSTHSNDLRQRQIDEDENLARALALSEQEYSQSSRITRTTANHCALS